jgi:Protein of unknown function (DUF2458)
MGEHRNYDLQRILAGLNGTIQDPTFLTGSGPDDVTIPGLGLLPPESQIINTHTIPARVESPARSKTTISAPDPSIITTWPAALKYVTKHIVTNDAAASRIKHLITQQAKHEREWWAGREALVEKQLGRAGKQREVAALLQSIGGLAAPIAVSNDPVANQRELEVYDGKVYAELVKMSADFDRQLRGLGVPFFAIKHALVMLDGDMRQNITGGLDKGELRELQKKMLQTLEDLLID